MDKKTQKRVTILRQRVQKLKKMLAGVKAQNDDPDEVKWVEAELQKVAGELDCLLKM